MAADEERTYAHDAHCNTIHEAGPEPCPPRRESVALLTDTELRAIDYTAALWHELGEIVGPGPSRAGDLRELVVHIHAIQHAVMSQAAARAYPDRFRLLGGTLDG